MGVVAHGEMVHMGGDALDAHGVNVAHIGWMRMGGWSWMHSGQIFLPKCGYAFC